MTNDELILQFENCTLPKDEFHHAAHVRTAWIYLKKYPVLDAIANFTRSLKAYADSLGAAGLYHETVSWGYMFLINERMFRSPGENWDEFAAANPDLLRWRDGAFMQYYGKEILTSDTARKVFVLPGKLR